MKKYYIIAILCVAAFLNVKAQKSEWEVPQDKAERLSPAEFTDKNVSEGETIYNANCVSCHGNPGQNNSIPLAPVAPGDPASEKFQLDTDGELLYKIQVGKGAMPSFKATLSTSQVWDVIAYIRTFHENYVQEVAEEVIRSGLSGGKVAIKLSWNEAKNTVDALITEVKPEETKAISGADVKLLAKRYFGEAAIGEVKTTNNDGKVSFEAPANLPGDTTGNVELILKLVDEEAFGEVSQSTVLPVGKPTITHSLIEKRAMWGTVQKAPLWILFTYAGGVIAAWSIIFFIFFQLRQIYMAGKKDEETGVVHEEF